MKYVLSTEEMYRYDHFTSEKIGIPEMVLMERAALGMFNDINENIFSKEYRNVYILCGTGNNGGDGLALARLMFLQGINVNIIYIGNNSKASESNIAQQNILKSYENLYEDAPKIIYSSCEQAIDYLNEHKTNSEKSIYIDAMFGIGLKRELDSEYTKLLNCLNQMQGLRIAVDIPTGLNADGKFFSEDLFNADITYTFGFYKYAHLIYPAAKYCGKVNIVDMGIDKYSICGEPPHCYTDDSTYDFDWPIRSKEANKGTYGKMLIIAGSKDICGALLLSAHAAFSCGIGMVKVITHINNRDVLMTKFPEAMISTYDDGMSSEEIVSLVSDSSKWADSILIGPGLGTGEQSRIITRFVVGNIELPTVIDADAINIISSEPALCEKLYKNDTRKIIMTPHIGELSRLISKDIRSIKDDFLNISIDSANKLHCTMICKDANSVIASNENNEVYINISGNDGMATAGSGDVLAGICAVFLTQTNDAFMSAASASYIHGIAGCKAMNDLGSRAMKASDIAIYLKDLWV